MGMKRIEAETLEEAYSKAAKELACSVIEINYEIIQHPTTGVMGLFKKTAIIVAVRKSLPSSEKVVVEPRTMVETLSEELSTTTPPVEVVVEKEVIETTSHEKDIDNLKALVEDKNEIVDNFFNEDVKSIKPKVETKIEPTIVETKSMDGDEHTFDDDRDTPENRERSIDIEKKILKLMEVACFEVDTVEVDVFNGIAHIFIDGEDAALLIGKEGYRYNALSYMLFNWINSHYNLYIKLEISEFIQAQEEMIDNYLKPIAEHIIEHGRGKTKPLDGILVQIALEKLRAMFPNKYIAIKTGKDSKKFIIINDFNSKKK
jgi:spoIIIJ-associated protein